MHGSDTRSCEGNSELKQPTFQRIGGRDPRPIHVEDIDERGGSASAEFCTATFRPETGDGDDLGTGVVASGASASLVGTTLVASSPSVIPSIEPMTPERTPSPTSLKRVTPQRQTNDCEQSYLDLLDQAIDDFVNKSHEQIQ
ncbi:hypothetical protein QQX98_010498 [Neonectria punicea]|uniref:Uncharacterized protein n=1 Tax=Neonectria punicea TaxID=979145 RepID=A0ABR1GP95_9HYPO